MFKIVLGRRSLYYQDSPRANRLSNYIARALNLQCTYTPFSSLLLLHVESLDA